jgi:uncharacterized protein
VSRENVELVQRVWEAWDRGDMSSVFELYADDIEWTMYPGLTLPEDVETRRGHDAVKRYHRELFEVWGEYSASAEQIEDLGEQVLVRVKVSGVSKIAGAPGDITVWHLWDVRDGKVARVHGYPTEAEARAVAEAVE